MPIPQELYERVFDLTTRMVQARERDDTRTCWQLYNELSACCEEHAHPFAWEALADFTSDDQASLPLYARALELARNAPEFAATIQLALAQRHVALGNGKLALSCLDAAAAAARSCAAPDSGLLAEIAAMQQELG